MFLESTYQPQQKDSLNELSIYDVAILTAQIGDKPFLKISSTGHLTSGMVQMVCYIIQGQHIVHTGRSLFKEDFYVINNRIENPKITELFGEYDKRVTPFYMTEAIKALLSPTYRGFGPDTNKMCQKIIYETVPKDYKELMKEFRETKPFLMGREDEFNKIDKAYIKEYFESQIIKPTQITEIQIGAQ